jgi:hypothetical protein
MPKRARQVSAVRSEIDPLLLRALARLAQGRAE